MSRSYGYAIRIALIISIGGLLLGISAMISGANEYYRSYFGLELGSFSEGLATGAAMLGTFIGNFFAGKVSDKYGRKKALIIASVLFSFCTLGSALAPTYSVLVISRLIGGLGIGISLLVAPLFIAEFSPKEQRGLLVSFNQLNIGLGYLLAYILNSFIIELMPHDENLWRWMLGVGFAFPLIYLVLLYFVPESPRWLFIQNKKKEAHEVLSRVGGTAYADNEVSDLKKLESSSSEESSSVGSLFSKRYRKILIIGLTIAFFQMASGLNTIFFFGPKILRIGGFGGSDSFFQSNLIGIVMVIMTVVSMVLIDKLGRKPLLYIGVTIMIIGLGGMGLSFNKAKYEITQSSKRAILSQVDTKDSFLLTRVLNVVQKEGALSETVFFTHIKQRLAEGDSNNSGLYSKYKDPILDNTISINSVHVLIFILLVVLGFSISLGPITWALLSEIFPSHLRGFGISVCGALNGITSFLVTVLFPIELEKFGAGNTFFIFCGFMISCLLCVYFIYPETKGKSLEEIEDELIDKSDSVEVPEVLEA